MYSVLGSLFIFYFHKNSIFNIKATEVAVIGLVGYFIFTVGLINSMILFSLARPLLVLKSMSLGLVLNLVIGYILSHSLSLHYAVWGFVIGASIFAFYSTKQVLSMLSQPDYAYYSS
jgi:O-antigen/teichoic acid export membrane protein